MFHTIYKVNVQVESIDLIVITHQKQRKILFTLLSSVFILDAFFHFLKENNHFPSDFQVVLLPASRATIWPQGVTWCCHFVRQNGDKKWALLRLLYLLSGRAECSRWIDVHHVKLRRNLTNNNNNSNNSSSSSNNNNNNNNNAANIVVYMLSTLKP